MIKRLIFRLVLIAMLIAGFKYACNSRKSSDPVAAEHEYTQKMTELTARKEAIEKEVADANAKAAMQPAKTPGSANEMLDALSKAYKEKDQYLAELQSIDVPKKFEEAHSTFLSYQKQEHETEAKLIDGYKAYNAGKKELAASIDSLVQSSEKISKSYEDKLDAIAKKNGFSSIQNFFSQKLGSK